MFVQEICKRLRELKREKDVVKNIRSISLDTAGNYLVERKDRPEIAYKKEYVEEDVERFVSELSQDECKEEVNEVKEITVEYVE